jgi:hypothetical protein
VQSHGGTIATFSLTCKLKDGARTVAGHTPYCHGEVSVVMVGLTKGLRASGVSYLFVLQVYWYGDTVMHNTGFCIPVKIPMNRKISPWSSEP